MSDLPTSTGAAPRRWFVGDLQGCCAELRDLLERIEFRRGVDRLFPVGDLVNRGPDNVGCLELLIQLEARPVLGNHDLHLLRAARGERELGALDTLADVLRSERRDALLGWLEAQPFLRDHGDLWQVHAGLHPLWREPLAELADLDPYDNDARIGFCTRVRQCSPEGELPQRGADPEAPPFAPWDRFYRPEDHDGRRVVFGHWSVRGRVEHAGAIGLDTGCVWGRDLSAWCPELDRWASVPARRAYQQPG